MKYDIDPAMRQRAKLPHNLFMLNLAVFHLLMTPAAIALNAGLWGMLLPLGLSLSVMVFTRWRSHQFTENNFEYLHWKLALLRYRYLLFAYGVTGGFILLGVLLSHATPDVHMQHILQTVFLRIAIMPTLIMVMINFYLESNAINLANNGEIPDALLAQQ